MASDDSVVVYAKKMQQVFDYINNHLDEALSVEILSQQANFSKFHFHRQFTNYAGVSVLKYVQLMRLKRASYRLAFNHHERITDIALDALFENPESFSRAFKVAFEQTPSQFRKKPDWTKWRSTLQLVTPAIKWKAEMNVKILDFKKEKIAVLEHRGAPDRVLESAQKFIEWRKHSGLSPVKSSATYGIAYDDPENTAPEKFRFDICGSISEDVPVNPQGVKSGVIPGGRCAVMRHEGSHDNIGQSVYRLYGEWLPQSGETLRDYPCFFHYLNLIHEVEEHELLTDIYLPLK